MTWAEWHSRSEVKAAEAELARRAGRFDDATVLYEEAARAEMQALTHLSRDKFKTLGITAVSAVALFYKGRAIAEAERLAHHYLASEPLPEFAKRQLHNLLQVVWTTRGAEAIGVNFVSGAVLVSVKGGQVVYGGAPLDLIVSKVSEIQAVFVRTVEMLLGIPFRKRGQPSTDIQGVFTPWLFQVPAGSYQFAVRIQEPPQLEMFAEALPKVAEVAATFLAVMKAAVDDPDHELADAVPDPDYRGAFLRLARNLAPTGKRYERLEIIDASAPASGPITLSREVRLDINAVIRKEKPITARDPRGTIKELRGQLRGLHLDDDWLELVTGPSIGEHVRIHDAGDVLDDVVGPMVNRHVVVTVEVGHGQRLSYKDIELDE
jgi:hypothetical protein